MSLVARGDGKAGPDEMIAINAARLLHDGQVCFVGIGLPSTAALLAQRTAAPQCVLIYESGTLGTRPSRLPLSIGDAELAETAQLVVPMAEVFNYWLQGGRVDVGFLGAAQVDRGARLNTTVIGNYAAPRVRLPGAGGAPEIAGSAHQVVVLARHSVRTFVECVDFVTTSCARRPSRTSAGRDGATLVVTDLGILRLDPARGELVLDAVHPGVTVEAAVEATGWPLQRAETVAETAAPSVEELEALRALTATSG